MASSKHNVQYRPDIDGLRAVAVLSVFAFHEGYLKTPGVFVGVDVFFVISGYLISSTVFAEISGSSFSVLGFYERRIRRIFPALFTMLAVTSAFAAILLLPSELVNYANSLSAAAVSASNFYFWQHSDNFDRPLDNPLLHTWSLAVEEQFYILFPLFLILARRISARRLRAAVVVLGLLSLASSAWIVVQNPNAGFYAPYTRAWELLMGTTLSLGLFPRLHSPFVRNLVTITGMGLIIYSVLCYSAATPFPGVAALLPCLGSSMIIGAGEVGSSVVGCVLAWRPVVFIGLISYSFYLWHWPVIVFQEMGVIYGNDLRKGLSMLLSGLITLILASISWRFIEQPFRKGRLRMSGKPLFTFAAAAILLSLVYSAFVVHSAGLPRRFPPEALQMAAYLDRKENYGVTRKDTCFITPDSHFASFQIDTCLHQDPGKDNDLLLGDSHAAVIWKALSEALPDENVMQANTASCKPYPRSGNSPDCKMMMQFIFERYLPEHPVHSLFLEARWTERDLPLIGETIDWAKEHKIHVILFGPTPEFDGPLPRLLTYSITWNMPRLTQGHRKLFVERLDSELQKLAMEKWRVPYVSLYQANCPSGTCTVYADVEHRIPLMFDSQHYTLRGSELVVGRVIEKGGLQ